MSKYNYKKKITTESSKIPVFDETGIEVIQVLDSDVIIKQIKGKFLIFLAEEENTQ